MFMLCHANFEGLTFEPDESAFGANNRFHRVHVFICVFLIFMFSLPS